MKMLDSIKKWYVAAYPTDELGNEIDEEVSFASVWNSMFDKGDDIYRHLGVNDSVVRERVFSQIAEILGVDYDVVYYAWLGEYRIALNNIVIGK